MSLSTPQFFVLARVVGRDGTFGRWSEIIESLCKISKTEAQGTSYYWGQDLDGEPDTMWGLEGYMHAVGFYLGHPASDGFKREMSYVAKEKLLKYDEWNDLKHYDLAGGFLTRKDDPYRDAMDSHVAALHFWAHPQQYAQEKLVQKLCAFADTQQKTPDLQSCGVLKGCWDLNLVTLWVRSRSESAFKKFQSSQKYELVVSGALASGSELVERTEIHRSRSFTGHLDQQPICEQ